MAHILRLVNWDITLPLYYVRGSNGVVGTVKDGEVHAMLFTKRSDASWVSRNRFDGPAQVASIKSIDQLEVFTAVGFVYCIVKFNDEDALAMTLEQLRNTLRAAK